MFHFSLKKIRLHDTIDRLEQKCEELTKQFEDVRYTLDAERRKQEKIHESIENEPAKAMLFCKESKRHNFGSASEPEIEEVCLLIY
jgi:predicted site-specific integrase-resolvase